MREKLHARDKRRGNEKLTSLAHSEKGDQEMEEIGGDVTKRSYRSGVSRFDALDELLVREDRVAEESLHVAEEDLHILRISIFDCGEFLSLN